MCPRGQRTLLALRWDIFIKCNAKRAPFLLHQTLSLFSTINLVYVLEINIFGRDYSNLNNLFPRYQSPKHMQGLLWIIGTQMNTSIQWIIKMKKFIFWVMNEFSYSNWKAIQDWNTPIHLKNNGPHIKFSSIFLVSYHDFQVMFLSPIVGYMYTYWK